MSNGTSNPAVRGSTPLGRVAVTVLASIACGQINPNPLINSAIYSIWSVGMKIEIPALLREKVSGFSLWHQQKR